MKFFIDTAKIDEIKQANDWGILDGVTTNPTLIARAGGEFVPTVREICKIVDGPVNVEVIGLTAPEMVAEARKLAALHKNIVVKIPMIKEGLKAVKILSKEGIKTNVTLAFSANQALLAAKANAAYVSPFIGRLDAIGHVGMDVIRQIRTIYGNYGFKTQIIVASIRHPLHVLDAALAGADIATIPFVTMEELFKHPLTDAGLQRFLEDWKKVPAQTCVV
jgi:transaldolase